MNAANFLLGAAPLLIFFSLCFVISIRSLGSCPFKAWQLVALIAFGVANLILALWLVAGPMLYLVSGMLVLAMGTNLVGLFWLKRRKSA